MMFGVPGVGKFDLHKATLDWGFDGSRLLHEWGFTEGIDNEGKEDGKTSYRRAGKPKGPYLAFLQKLGLAEEYVKEPHNGSIAYTTSLPDYAYCDNWISENGLRFFQEFPRSQPWHLVVNFVGPHPPMDVTQSMRERWDDVEFPPSHNNNHPEREELLIARQNYAAMIENIDRQVGRFIDLVQQRGETDNTIIVYASDHGEMLGDHGLWGKSVWHTPSTGIPLIISGPGIAKGKISDALGSLHDLAATFVDYCRAAPMLGMDAISLRPILEGNKIEHRNYVVSGLNDWRMIFEGRYKLVTGLPDTPLLYDLLNDPWEDTNIAGRHPGIVQSLSNTLTYLSGGKI